MQSHHKRKGLVLHLMLEHKRNIVNVIIDLGDFTTLDQLHEEHLEKLSFHLGKLLSKNLRNESLNLSYSKSLEMLNDIEPRKFLNNRTSALVYFLSHEEYPPKQGELHQTVNRTPRSQNWNQWAQQKVYMKNLSVNVKLWMTTSVFEGISY